MPPLITGLHHVTAFAKNPALANFEAITRSNMELFEQAMRLFRPFVPGSTPGAAEAEGQAPVADTSAMPASKGEIDRLQRQLSEMQTKIEQLSREKP